MSYLNVFRNSDKGIEEFNKVHVDKFIIIKLIYLCHHRQVELHSNLFLPEIIIQDIGFSHKVCELT